METELSKRTEAHMGLDDQLKQAEMFIKSGFFPKHIDTPQKAIVIIQKGKELGLPKIEALSKISVINGQPCTKVETLLGLARRTGQLEDLIIKDHQTYCEVTIKRKGQSPHTCRFGDDEATAMGLTGKDNYKKQKGTMYQWRSLSKNLRVTFPDAIGGLYLEEEIADDVIIQTATEDRPAEVTEILTNQALAAEPQHAKPSDPTDNLKAEDIPADSIPNWTFPMGKYAGKRLIEVYGHANDTGKQKGKEYLEWCAANLTDKKMRTIISRFLEIMQEPSVIDMDK